MSPYRLVALDVDGTLLTSDKRITRRSQRVLETLHRRGIRLCLTTGRNLRMARRMATSLGIEVGLVAHNGAVVYEEGLVVSAATLPQETASETVRRLQQEGCLPMLYVLSEGDCRLFYEPSGVSRVVERYLHANGEVSTPVASIEEAISGVVEPLHVVAIEPESRVRFALATFSSAGEVRWLTSGGYGDGEHWFLEAISAKASKWEGLKLLAERHGVALEEVVALGDNLNDLDLLEGVGLGIAMGNAPEVVKASARWVTASNDEEGVALALERLFSV